MVLDKKLIAFPFHDIEPTGLYSLIEELNKGNKFSSYNTYIYYEKGMLRYAYPFEISLYLYLHATPINEVYPIHLHKCVREAVLFELIELFITNEEKNLINKALPFAFEWLADMGFDYFYFPHSFVPYAKSGLQQNKLPEFKPVFSYCKYCFEKFDIESPRSVPYDSICRNSICERNCKSEYNSWIKDRVGKNTRRRDKRSVDVGVWEHFKLLFEVEKRFLENNELSSQMYIIKKAKTHFNQLAKNLYKQYFKRTKFKLVSEENIYVEREENKIYYPSPDSLDKKIIKILKSMVLVAKVNNRKIEFKDVKRQLDTIPDKEKDIITFLYSLRAPERADRIRRLPNLIKEVKDSHLIRCLY